MMNSSSHPSKSGRTRIAEAQGISNLGSSDDSDGDSNDSQYPLISTESNGNQQTLSSLTTNYDSKDSSLEFSSSDDGRASSSDGHGHPNHGHGGAAAAAASAAGKRKAPPKSHSFASSNPNKQPRIEKSFSRGEVSGYEDEEEVSSSVSSEFRGAVQKRAAVSAWGVPNRHRPFSPSLDLRDKMTTVAGQLEAHPHWTESQAELAATREYNRRNAARARLRSKNLLQELQDTCANLTKRIEDLYKENISLRSRLKTLNEEEEAAAAAAELVQQPTAVPLVAASASAPESTSQQTQLASVLQQILLRQTSSALPAAAVPPADQPQTLLVSNPVRDLLVQLVQRMQDEQKQREAQQQQENARNLLLQLLTSALSNNRQGS